MFRSVVENKPNYIYLHYFRERVSEAFFRRTQHVGFYMHQLRGGLQRPRHAEGSLQDRLAQVEFLATL